MMTIKKNKKGNMLGDSIRTFQKNTYLELIRNHISMRMAWSVVMAFYQTTETVKKYINVK